MIETNNTDLTVALINSFTQQNEILIKSLMNILYRFRGALNREDIWMMSPIERDYAVDFINERIKEAGDLIKKQIPVFI